MLVPYTLIAFAASAALVTSSAIPFNWTAIIPTPDLRYHDCYEVFKCARLQVPLDWSASVNHINSTGPSVAIGIVTLPATVPESDPSHGGTVLFNPGGPNGAATETMLLHGTGQRLQNILAGDRHYEILAFDPRGVGETTPGLDCYAGNLVGRDTETYETRGIGRWAEGPDGVRDRYLYAQAASQLCEENLADFLPYASSASVARDMVEIVDRVDELRRKTTKSISTEPAKIQYMGFSYGTALGMVFASMFPERIGRFMFDGIVDIDDYRSGSWKGNLYDTESILDDFYQRCFSVNCTLALPSDDSWTSIKTRVNKFLTAFDSNPVSVHYRDQVTILTSDDLRLQIFIVLYGPNEGSLGLAALLADTIAGNYTSLAASLFAANQLPPPYVWRRDVLVGVSYLDGSPDAGNRTLEYYQDLVTYLQAQAPTVGAPGWAYITMGHAGRRIRPAYDYRGPYTIPRPDPSNSAAPAAPILFLSTRLDPVTPLRNAWRMADLFPDSTVMVQESAGHCAVFASDSKCTARVIRAYFDRGEMPVNGTSCAEDCQPFLGCKGQNRTLVRRNSAFGGLPRKSGVPPAPY